MSGRASVVFGVSTPLSEGGGTCNDSKCLEGTCHCKCKQKGESRHERLAAGAARLTNRESTPYDPGGVCR